MKQQIEECQRSGARTGALRCLEWVANRMPNLKKGMRRPTGDEKGMVVMLVLILIITLSLLAAAANRNVVTDVAIASNHLGSVQAFYAADAASQYGYNQLWQQLQLINPNTASITPPALAGYTISYSGASFVQAIGNRVQRPATGTYAGLSAFVQRWRIAPTATENKTGAMGMVTIDVEDQLIPIFQFGVFYNHDLEMLPGANMTFTAGANGIGRIHTNSNVYMAESGSSVSLTVNAPITSAENLYAYRKDGGSTNHNVYISNGQGSTPLLNIDSTSANWTTQSQTTWLGQVKTVDHGITALNVPMPTSTGQPIDLVGTGTGSLYQSAGLRIVDGVARNKSGAALDLRYYDATYKDTHGNLIIDPGGDATHNVNPLTTGTLYDYRQGGVQNTYDLDLTKLQNSPAAMAALNNPPASCDPGILYVSSTSSTGSKAVRLENGGSIPATGLTIATNNPVYVEGNYNTANNPSAIAADAVTVLSSNWRDTYNSGTSISSRTAAATTVNAAFMVGNKDTAGSQYSGGLENLVRFLENWSGVNFTYRGSLVCLWQSAQANSNWPGTGTVYNPPNRVWSYGIDVNHLPPGTPRVRYVMKLGWRVVTN
ncbi:MAG TPA: PilX N-terminal domain-containing pilus assembly protein [Syntrophorhabdales bacterium]|nr:PilX N-terminal domain-containing pilus assembly protein [Syntrophorhabdales bacterium]